MDNRADLADLHKLIEHWRQEEKLARAAEHAENRAELERMGKELLAVSAVVKTAFPEGDFDGHRRYHEILIQKEERRQEFRQGLMLHIAKTSTWACIVGLFVFLAPVVRNVIKEWLKL